MNTAGQSMSHASGREIQHLNYNCLQMIIIINYMKLGGTLSLTVIVVEIESVTRIRIQDEAVYISLRADCLKKIWIYLFPLYKPLLWLLQIS